MDWSPLNWAKAMCRLIPGQEYNREIVSRLQSGRQERAKCRSVYLGKLYETQRQSGWDSFRPGRGYFALLRRARMKRDFDARTQVIRLIPSMPCRAAAGP